MIQSKSIRPLVRNSATCKLAFFAGYLGESCSQWFLVAFCAERLTALIWPLRVRQFCASSSNWFKAVAIVFIVCAIVCAPVLVVFDLRDPYCYAVHSGYTGRTEAAGSRPMWATIMAYVTTAQKYGYSTLIMMALAVLIFAKLLLIRYRQKYSTVKNGETSRTGNICKLIHKFLYFLVSNYFILLDQDYFKTIPF